MIPRRIICTHKNTTALLQVHRYCFAQMQRLHPDWDIQFFSDGDCLEFIANHRPEYAELYAWYPRPVMKADLFRLLAVDTMGGFYLDLDVWLVESLDMLCEKEAVFPWEHEFSHRIFSERYPGPLAKGIKRWQVGNYAFGARPSHPFLAAILAELVARTNTFHESWCSDHDILRATGPDMVTTVYYRNPSLHNTVEVLRGGEDLDGPSANLGPGSQPDWQRFGKYGSHLLTSVWKH